MKKLNLDYIKTQLGAEFGLKIETLYEFCEWLIVEIQCLENIKKRAEAVDLGHIIAILTRVAHKNSTTNNTVLKRKKELELLQQVIKQSDNK